MVQPHELTVSSCPVCPLVQRERVLACDLISRVKDRPHLGKIRQYFSGLTTLLWPIINALVVPEVYSNVVDQLIDLFDRIKVVDKETA
jgi:hypothetical protein